MPPQANASVAQLAGAALIAGCIGYAAGYDAGFSRRTTVEQQANDAVIYANGRPIGWE